MNLEVKQGVYFLIVLILMATGLSLVFIKNSILWSLTGIFSFALSICVYNRHFKRI
jgi:hypothetical protein